MAVLASGTAAAQAIAVVSSPILARVYSPDAFGTFGVFLAIVSLGAVGVALRYEVAIPLPDSDQEALDVLALALLVVVVMSLLVALGVWAVAHYVAEAVPRSIQATLWLVPLALLLTGLFQTLTFWATRVEAFAVSARAGVAQSATQTLSQLAFGFLGVGAIGMIMGHLIGRTSGVGILLAQAGLAPRALPRGLSAGRLRSTAGRYRRFPLVALWSSLLNSASFQIPVLLLASLFEAAVVGWFLLTVRVLQLPLTLIGSAVGQVFYTRASRSLRDDLGSTTSKVFRSLVVFGTGPMVLLALGGEQGFALVFGDAWREAGTYAQWLAPWLLFVFVASPLSPLVFVLSRQRGELAFQLALVTVRLGALFVGWLGGSAILAIGLFGAGSAVLWGIYMIWLLGLSGAGIRDGLAALARELAFSIALASPVLVANLLEVQGVAWAAICTAVLACMGIRAVRQLEMARR